MGTLLSIGASAPEFVVRADRGTLAPASAGQPRVLAFVRDWSIEREQPEALRAIRGELRGLGAELLVLSDAGVWIFRPDDDIEQVATYSDRLAADIETAALLYGVRGGPRDRRSGEAAIFVIDDRGVIRFAHGKQPGLTGELAQALAAASEALLAPKPFTMTRREWVTSCLVAGFAFTLLRGCKQAGAPAEEIAEAAPQPAGDIDIVLDVNGKRHPLRVEARTSLLDALREQLGLTGTKKGCDMGQCGACTVLLDGRRVVSCLTLAVVAHDRPVTTIEGLAKGGELHPVQAAFVEHDALQCGYCTPGQIMSAVGLLAESPGGLGDNELRDRMSGNLCRCGAYPNIRAAILAVHGGRK
ncbi:MAG: 2Fe-2S iron-sulfur cluster-binding protein [Acidobacteriota bacterium]